MGLIYLDSCLVIYLMERHAHWYDKIGQAMQEAGANRFAISPMVKLECLVGPLKRGDPILRKGYVDLFDHFLGLEMPEQVYLQAAELRAQFGIRTPDALHLACAQYHRCEALWTNDDRFARASHGLGRNVLGG